MQQEVKEIQSVLEENPTIYQVMKIADEIGTDKMQETALKMLKGELKGMRTDHIQIFR